MIQTFVALTALIQAIFLGGRLAGFILANSTLSHVLSAAIPAKKTASARLPPLEIFPTRRGHNQQSDSPAPKPHSWSARTVLFREGGRTEWETGRPKCHARNVARRSRKTFRRRSKRCSYTSSWEFVFSFSARGSCLSAPKRAFVGISFRSHALRRYRARVGVFVVPNGAVLATSLEVLSLGRLVGAALLPRCMLSLVIIRVFLSC